MKNFLRAITALIIVIGVSNSRAGVNIPQARIENFKAESRKIDEKEYRSAEQALAYRRIFEKYYGSSSSSGTHPQQSDVEITEEFEASAEVFFYTLDDKYIQAMENALRKLELRNLALPDHYVRMHKSFLAARDFAGAENLRKRKNIRPLDFSPSVSSNAVPEPERSEWTASENEPILTRSSYDMPIGPVVVMITNPTCHFSRNALRDIRANPQILARILPILKLIAPPELSFDFRAYQDWNNRNPLFPISIMHKVAEWPELDDRATPNFYFFRDKKLIATVTGWPAKGHMPDIENALNLIGAN